MIPTLDMLVSTFFIRQHGIFGTAFAINSNDRQYLVTAKHVVPDIGARIRVNRGGQWDLLPTDHIQHHPGNADVAVIPLITPVTSSNTLTPSAPGVMIGQNVLIAGFPFGWTHPQTDLNDGYPIPFLKGAILSTIIRQDDTSVVLLDGHNNKGFSGGPIIAEDISQGSNTPPLRIIGVVSGFEPEILPHPDELSKALDPNLSARSLTTIYTSPTPDSSSVTRSNMRWR